jgi:hypothetical protein
VRESERAPPLDASMPVPMWGPETIHDPQLSRIGIVINRDAGVMVCVVCHTAISPKGMHGHIRQSNHSLGNRFRKGGDLAFATHEFCQATVTRFGLKELKSQQPKSIIPPIPGLPIYHDFYCCNKCGYAVRTPQRISGHLGGGACQGSGYTKGSAQTFLPTSRRFYFGIMAQEIPHPEPLDAAALFEKQFSFNPYENAQVQAGSHPRDMNIFLKGDNWLVEVEGMRAIDIFNIAHNPLPNLRKQVRKAVDLYISDIVSKLKDVAGPAEQLQIGDYDQ